MQRKRLRRDLQNGKRVIFGGIRQNLKLKPNAAEKQITGFAKKFPSIFQDLSQASAANCHSEAASEFHSQGTAAETAKTA